jgi:hypothetical protein
VNSYSCKKSDGRPQRGGGAATDLAVCLPVIVLMALAMIESCAMVSLNQSCSVAAYAGARTALLDNASATDVRRASQLILLEHRVKGGTITVRPSNFQTLPPGESIEVTVEAPLAQSGWIAPRFSSATTMRSVAILRTEQLGD